MKQINIDLWFAETSFTLMGAELGNRMTIIRLNDDQLLLHSPIKISDELLESVKAIGDVGILVTPNNFHGLFVDEWLKEFPDAKHFTAKELKSTHPLTYPIQAIYDVIEKEVLAIIKLEGTPRLNEYAFIHKPTGTLILTDIAFNIGTNISTWSRIFFKLNGAYNHFGPSGLMKTLIRHPLALKVSIDEILTHEIKRIIVSHGDIVEENAAEALQNAFRHCSRRRVIKPGLRFKLSRCG